MKNDESLNNLRCAATFSKPSIVIDCRTRKAQKSKRERNKLIALASPSHLFGQRIEQLAFFPLYSIGIFTHKSITALIKMRYMRFNSILRWTCDFDHLIVLKCLDRSRLAEWCDHTFSNFRHFGYPMCPFKIIKKKSV